MSRKLLSIIQKKRSFTLGIIFLLLLNALNSYAKSQVPDITISGENINLSDIIKSIEKQTGLSIIFDPNLCNLKMHDKYSLSFNKADIQEVISFLIKPSKLTYEIKKNTLRIYPIYRSVIDTILLPTVNGTIKDNAGNAIPGVTIKIKNTQKGTTTDSNGKFVLSDIHEGDKIVISSIGYETKEILADDKNIIAELDPFINNLNETQIIAYGQTSKRLNTGNVSTIKASQIEDLPVSNPMLAIQGRIPGMDITPTNGLPGASIKIRVQGNNSLFAGNDPLIVVDNVPYPSQPLSSSNNSSVIGSSILGTNGANQFGSTLSFINTADIESINVLKGADATSIYGSRAANGAILITTKKGKSGKLQVTFNLQEGLSKVGKEIKLMNREQYLEMRREAFANDGITTPGRRDYDLNGAFDTTLSHNWQKELYGETAHNTIASIGISGGSENVTYLVSGTYSKQSTVFPEYFHSFYDQREIVHTNVVASSPNKKFIMNFSLNYMDDLNKLPKISYVKIANTLPPTIPDMIDNNGQISWKTMIPGLDFDNPIANSLGTYEIKSTNLIGNLSLSYQIVDGLKIISNLGYNLLDQKDVATTPTDAIPPSVRNTGTQNSSSFNNRTITTYNIEPQISYNKTIQKSQFQALLGSTIIRNTGYSQAFIASGFSSDLLLKDITSASYFGSQSSNDIVYRYAALFGRLNYTYNDRYILQITGRRDGSSRFGPENRFNTFGSVAGAWIFSEEPFIRKALPFLYFGKIRSSYGTTGNDQIGDYSFLSLYQAISASRPYQGVTGMKSSAISNPYLQWEKVNKFEIGLETGFLENRISLNVNFALNRSSNLLTSRPLPSTSGFTEILTNMQAKVQNISWEFTLNSINIQSPAFTWSTSITLTIPKNKILEYPGLESSTLADYYIVGQSAGAVKRLKLAGVNDSTGLYQFYNKKGEVVYDPDLVNDLISINNFDPKFFGALSNTFSYKSLSMNIALYFKHGNADNLLPQQYPPGSYGRGQNLPAFYLDRWQKPGDKATYMKYTTVTNNSYTYYKNSDAAIINQYFIRCSYITLAWKLPKKWENSMRMSNCEINTQIMNPFIITNNKISPDPETGLDFPLLTSFNFGIKATF